MAEVTISSKNQIVVPREAREALGLKPGDKLLIITKGDRVIVIEKPASFAAAIRGMARRPYPKNHLRKERGSWR